MMTQLSPALQIIADEVGLLGLVPSQEIMNLVRAVGMEHLVMTNPRLVAHEITYYINDLVNNP